MERPTSAAGRSAGDDRSAGSHGREPVPAALGRVTELVRSRGAAAQLCVLRDGEAVLDEAVGCAPDALFWTFSAGKPLIALLVHLLAERGALDLDDPVARHWPEFGARGKEQVTVRQVLRHRSGLATARGMLGDALAMTDWQRSVRALEGARLKWPPGRLPAYQPIAYGFILGEVARRVAGTPPADLMNSELLAPLGVTGVHPALPDDLWSLRVPVRGRGPAGALTQRVVNRRRVRHAVIPSAGVSANARGLAAFYRALLDAGRADGKWADGVRVLKPSTVAEARRPSSDGREVDRVIKLPIRWAQGFQLGGPGPAPDTGDGGPVAPDPARTRPMGRLSHPEAFGHNGSNCCLAWADPHRGIAFAYLTDRLTTGPEAARHLCEVSDAVLTAWD